jgi:rod shape-determining protein MreD
MAVRTGVSFWFFIVILVIAHLVLHVAIGLGTVAPDLLTVAVLLSARRLSATVAAGIGLLLGLLVDALSLTTFGAVALINSVIGLVGARSRDLFEGDSIMFVAGYIFVGKWLHDCAYLALTHSVNGEPWSTLLTSAPLSALYAAVAGVVALTLYRAAMGER